MAMIPVKYVGPKETEVEHNYGSGVFFKQGEVTMVPDYAAKILLERHPSEYQDGRHHKQQHLEIKPVEPVPPKFVEDVEPPPLVNLDAMTKEQLVTFTHKQWGVELDAKGKKADLIDRARSLMGGAPKGGY